MTPTRQKLRLGKMPAGIGPAYRQWVENALRKIATLAGAQVLIEGATQSTIGVDGEQYIKVPGTAADSHPFKVTAVSGDEFNVQAGTAEGIAIDSQIIDVGSTRPVAILVKMQYTLSVDNSVYVWASSVKTGANAPELVSSTSVFDDVDSAISNDEARALVAIIDADENITQYTTGNIIGTFEDDGSLTGKMSGSYNKNA